MGILPNGATMPNNVTFNSGIVNVNGQQLAVLQEVTVNIEFGEKEFYALGSIKMVVPPKRYGFKPSLTGKVKSLNPNFYNILLGEEVVDGSGYDYTVIDGQNVLSVCAVKCIINENTNQTVEFQFINAVIHSTFGLALKMEDAGEVNFQITSQDLMVVTNF